VDRIQIEIKRLPPQGGKTFLAASFKEIDEDLNKNVSNKIDLSVASKDKINVLERELRINRENLQSTIEELEASNEELQASNEEMQSSNEELESVNEELYTVNAEFQEKVIELSESNNDLNNLIQSTDIAILFLDSSLQIRKYTPAVKKIMQLMPQDIGRHISHFRSIVQLKDFIAHVERVHETLIPFESTVNDTSGKEFIIRIAPFITAKKEVKGVVLSFIDISTISIANRKLELINSSMDEATLKFKEKSDLFNLIANNINEMISLHDLKGTIKYVTPSCYQMTGYSEAELLDIHPSKLIANDQSQKIWSEKFNEMLFGKNVGVIKYQIKTKNGEERWLETVLKQVTDASGNISLLMAVSRDFSSIVQLEDQINEFSMVVEQTTNSVVLTDLEDHITFVNQAFELITGYDENEVLGKKPGDFLQGEETDPETVELMSEAIEERKPFDVDVINYSKSGGKFWIHIHCEPMINKDNQVTGFFSIQYDVTHQKEYEIQISKLNDLLRDNNLKLEGLNKNLQQFAYVASHDLKAPLRNINGMIDLIQKKRDKISQEKLDEYFDIIYKAAKEMDRLIENLLEYSRSGQINEELEWIDLFDVMKEAEELFKNPLKEIKGKLEFKSDVKKIRVYPILFKRLLTNLISNAIKYRSKRPLRIQIHCIENQTSYQFKVADNGIGIAEGHLENIFNIFTTLQVRDDSNGIGLSVTKTIAEIHQGDIWVESEVGKGSTFYFEIRKL
jgi:two-component system CheB/CheR fusion protein